MTVGNVLNEAVSFPAVIFTITTIFFLGFWVVTTALGAGLDSIADFDVDVDTDVDVDVDVDADTGGGLLKTVMELLGITGMPVLLGVNLMSIFAWGTAMIAQLLIGVENTGAGVILGAVIFALALIVGRAITVQFGKTFDHALIPTPALRRRDFVGSMCTITTQKVTADFGQAEVRDREGGSLIIQVRSDKPNRLSAGDHALIFDVDDDELGAFQVSEAPELGS